MISIYLNRRLMLLLSSVLWFNYRRNGWTVQNWRWWFPIWPHIGRNRNRIKCTKFKENITFISQDLNYYWHCLFHDAFRGVINNIFVGNMLSKKTSNFNWASTPTVTGILGNDLNHKLPGQKVLLPRRGQVDSLQGIIQWNHWWKEIIANLVFYKDKGIHRLITHRKMGWV